MIKIIQVKSLSKSDYDYFKENFDCNDNDYIKLKLNKKDVSITIIKGLKQVNNE